MTEQHEADPIVAGAGPVGLTAALAARALGSRVTVLEAGSQGPCDPGSSALFVHRDSLRLLDRTSPGLGERIGRYGVVWRRRRTVYRGRHVYDRQYPSGDVNGLRPFTSLRQRDTERFLREACVAADVSVHWSMPVTAVDVTATGVRVRTEDGRPNRNPHAERFVRSVREECADRLLLFGRGHVEKVRYDYARHFNAHRPHQGRNQLAPLDDPRVIPLPTVQPQRRQAVAGLINRVPPSKLTTRRTDRHSQRSHFEALRADPCSERAITIDR